MVHAQVPLQNSSLQMQIIMFKAVRPTFQIRTLGILILAQIEKTNSFVCARVYIVTIDSLQ